MHTHLIQGKKKKSVYKLAFFDIYLTYACGHCLEGWDGVNCYFPFIS